MHYGAYAFSSNSQPTIVAKQAGITLLEPYDKTSLSTSDVEALRKAYPGFKIIQFSIFCTLLFESQKWFKKFKLREQSCKQQLDLFQQLDPLQPLQN